MDKNVREIALELLVNIDRNQAYSNIALNGAILEHQVKPIDAGLLTEIVYGTLQYKLTLDFYLKPFLQKRVEDWVQMLLRLSVYQMVYLDKIPEHAILNEAVEIAKKKGHEGIASVVNGVLRNIQRKGLPSIQTVQDDCERLSITTSHPRWITQLWIDQYGYETARQICEMNVLPPVQTARVNAAAATRDVVLRSLEDEGFVVSPHPVLADCIENSRGNIAFSAAHRDGYLTIQDASSMLVADVVNPQDGDVILDACAAPGGKTTHLLERLQGSGKVVALDIHKHKIKLVKKAASRLGFSNLVTKELDARKAAEAFEQGSFDRILVDAPCTGLGVLRRKPDAKYEKSYSDVRRLSVIQEDILTKVAPLVKMGGTLVYSTCTVNREENEEVVSAFLSQNSEFELDHTMVDRIPEQIRSHVNEGMLQVYPQHMNSDGFFIAAFRKKASH